MLMNMIEEEDLLLPNSEPQTINPMKGVLNTYVCCFGDGNIHALQHEANLARKTARRLFSSHGTLPVSLGRVKGLGYRDILCERYQEKQECFVDLSLPLPETNKDPLRLEDCIRELMQLEEMEGIECLRYVA